MYPKHKGILGLFFSIGSEIMAYLYAPLRCPARCVVPKRMPHSPKDGFTLVELAVTLVIIGIIIGAITSGAHLLQAARLNKLIAEITGYAKAVDNFRLKYHEWPGDMPNATNFWGNVTANGDGDEKIEGDTTERLRAWQHMFLADMVAGGYTGVDAGSSDFVINENVPGSVATNAYYFIYTTLMAETIYGSSGTVMQLGSSESDTSPYGGALQAPDAKIIDNKIDDGEANTGSLYAVRPLSQVATANTCVNGNYITDSSADFVLSDALYTCRMVLWLNKK